MMVYEYDCPQCGEIEVEQRITDSALTQCPNCDTVGIMRLISKTTFQLKGSGWCTDGYQLDSEKPHDDDGTGWDE